MEKKKTRFRSKAGAPPGTLIYIGEESFEKVRIQLMSYNDSGYSENEIIQMDHLKEHVLENRITWVNVDGVHNPEVIRAVCEQFGIHALVQEDIVNPNQRPKMEDYGEYLYFVLMMIDIEMEDDEEVMTTEQVSIVLGKNFILSFQEAPGDIWDQIRNRIRTAETKISSHGADYLAYRLMDSIIDQYFLVLENFGENIYELEEELIESPQKDTLTEVYELKRDLIYMRKAAWPMREIATELQRLDHSLITENLRVYLRDFYDHIFRVIDTIETFHDTSSSMVDLYMSSVSIKMNEVMKVLTVMSTIFIPLTFITGFYGMNLHIPEMDSPVTYPVIMGLMGLMVVGQLIWFKRKKWL